MGNEEEGPSSSSKGRKWNLIQKRVCAVLYDSAVLHSVSFPLLVLPFYPDSYGRRGGRDNGTIHLAAARKSKRKVPKTTRFFQETKKNTFGLKFSERIQNLREFMYRYWRISHFCARMAKSSKCLSLSLPLSIPPPLSISLPPPEGKGGRMEKRGKGSLSDLEEIPFITSFFFFSPFFPLNEKGGYAPPAYTEKRTKEEIILYLFSSSPFRLD